MEVIDAYRSISEEIASLIGAIRPDEFDAVTPCRGWDVGQLISALTAKTEMYAKSSTVAQPTKPSTFGSIDHEDVFGAYMAASQRAITVFADAANLTRSVTLPLGTMTGEAALQVALLDTFLHLWDLGKATGRRWSIDPAEVNLVERAARLLITDELRAKNEFAPPVDVSDATSDIDRIVAFSGRDPQWVSRPPSLG